MYKQLGLIAVLLLGLIATSSEAALYRIDYAGEITYSLSSSTYTELATPIPFHGYVILGELTQDPAPGDTIAIYTGVMAQGSVEIAGEVFTLIVPNELQSIVNITNNSSLVDDQFSTIHSYEGASGRALTSLLQFWSSDTQWLNDLEYPDSFSQDDVDPFVVGDSNTTLAAFFGYFQEGSVDDIAIGEFTYIDAREVPLPAALWLLISALSLLTFNSRKNS